MTYDVTELPLEGLLRPLSDAGSLLVRLDERLLRSPVGTGWMERSHFADACASLWVDGELVHMEDLVLHDNLRDVRAPTHELVVARDVLRSRRRIAAQHPGWALTEEGMRSLRRQPTSHQAHHADAHTNAPEREIAEPEGEGTDEFLSPSIPLEAEFAAIDAILARSEAALKKARTQMRTPAPEKDSLIYDLDWDEDERLQQWRSVLQQTEHLPPALQAVLALDAWSHLGVLQHAPWLGRLLSASILQKTGLTTGYLVAFNLGLKTVPLERRRHRDRDVRLLAFTQGLAAAAEIGLKEHDRLTLAHQMMERKLSGRRSSSKLPELIGLVMAKPLVSTEMVARALNVTPQAARRIVVELGLREMTGRGRFRAWGVV